MSCGDGEVRPRRGVVAAQALRQAAGGEASSSMNRILVVASILGEGAGVSDAKSRLTAAFWGGKRYA